MRKKTRGLKPRPLVTQKLQNISKNLFRKHYDLITKLVGTSPGIYCLYDASDLYYVGKSTDLRRRVKKHLHDRHLASWTHFSLYLVRRVEHIGEIESLLIGIANPEGNRRVPKAKGSGAMLKQLKALLKQKHAEEMKELLGGTKAAQQKSMRASGKHPKTLTGMVTRRTPLYKSYKGREYRAFLYPGGTIKIGSASFKTPTGAALSIVRRYGRRAVNGWTFWFIKDAGGEWVRLTDYRP